MKQLYIFLLASCMLLSLNSIAQTPDSTIAIPNPSFEEWSTGSGYSVTVYYFPLSIYDSYTYPTGWDYPTYPVNENITYSGLNVNVNTNVPLLKVSNVTSGAPDGSHALKLQSFMLSDLINPLVYNLAESSLDPMLTASVFPTVLSTGVVDIDHLLPLMDNITSNLGDLSQLVSLLSSVDMNTIVTGGLPLNGATPDRLSGYYKYTSAAGGDNGGIVILGTRHNPVTMQREVVGGGYSLALTDTSEYAPFDVFYAPLSEMDPSLPYMEADSVVIFLFSSANTNPKQGSALYLDNLQLWTQQEVVPEDTCSAVFNLHLIDVDTMNATIGWGFEGEPDHFQAEYGVQGFELGSGTTVGTTESFLHLSDLQPDTEYDLYVRCVCDSDLYGEWAMLTFHTDTLMPPAPPVEPEDSTGIQTLTTDQLLIYPNPTHGQCMVQFKQEIPKVARLYTLEGALVKEIIPTKETFELTMPTPGVYLLICEMKEGTVVKKVVSR